MPDHYVDHLRGQLAAVERTGRWSPGRKDVLLELLRRGALTVEEACARYGLSAEEVASWQSRAQAHGRRGLSVTKLQVLRR